MDRQSEILEILLKEYSWIKEDIKASLARIEKGLAFFLISISLAFGVGIRENICELMLIIPWLTIGFTYYVIMNLEGIFTDGGYAATIEERVNNLLDSEVLKWERKVSPRLQHFTWPQVLLFIIFAIILIFVVSMSSIISIYQYTYLTIVNLLLILILFIIANYFLLKMRSLHIKSQKIVNEISLHV